MTRQPTVIRQGPSEGAPIGTSGRGRLKIFNQTGHDGGNWGDSVLELSEDGSRLLDRNGEEGRGGRSQAVQNARHRYLCGTNLPSSMCAGT